MIETTTMLGNKVQFRATNGAKTEGIIRDKVNIPLVSGTNEYVPMDNYLIVDADNNVHIVNPINIIVVLQEKAVKIIGDNEISTLGFIYNRLECPYKENKNVDYMLTFKKVIDKLKNPAP